MALRALPTVFRGSARFERLVARAATVSPFTFQRQVTVYPGRMWIANIRLTPHTPAQADLIDQLLKDLVSEEDWVQFSAADWNRLAGPGTVTWTLDPSSPVATPRDNAGFSTPVELVFRERK